MFVVMTCGTSSHLKAMDRRTRRIFGEIVKTYLKTGEPVGSRTVARRGVGLSAAMIRNVMADLMAMGLLHAPHSSAGRAPTHAGLRVFVDGLLQIEDLTEVGRDAIDRRLATCRARSSDDLLGAASEVLSGLSRCAGLVVSPKREATIRHVEFVGVSPEQALAVIVTEDNDVENRLVSLPPGMPMSALTEASNYLRGRMRGCTLEQALARIRADLDARRAELDTAAASLVESGVALWSGEEGERDRALIVRGRANLLDSAENAKNLEKVRGLFEELERKQTLIDILDGAREGDGVRIFIGSENPLFSLSGSSLILAPYMDEERKVVGVLGVVGPTRINYARIIPVVSYTAGSLGRLLGKSPRPSDGWSSVVKASV